MKWFTGFTLGIITTITFLAVYVSVVFEYKEPKASSYPSKPIGQNVREQLIIDTVNSSWHLDRAYFKDFYSRRNNPSDLYRILQITDLELGNDENRNTLYLSFTDSLTKYNPLSQNSSASLINTITYAEQLIHTEYLDCYNEPVVRYIGEHLLQIVSDTIASGISSGSIPKYGYTAQYLRARLYENGYAISTKEDNLTKVVENFSNAKFGYLINRFIIVTPWYIQLISFLLIIIAAFSIVQSCIILLRRIKKKS